MEVCFKMNDSHKCLNDQSIKLLNELHLAGFTIARTQNFLEYAYNLSFKGKTVTFTINAINHLKNIREIKKHYAEVE